MDNNVEQKVGTIMQSHKNTFKTGHFFMLYVTPSEIYLAEAYLSI